jgi:predicted phosphodiesterase
MKTWAIGDIHSCNEETRELVERLKLQPEDRLCFVGDYTDRGPDCSDVLTFIEDLSKRFTVFAVMGNHDEKYVRYASHLEKKESNPAYVIPMNLTPNKELEFVKLTKANLNFLSTLPNWKRISVNNEPWIIVHAGLQPHLPIQCQNEAKLRHLRYLNKNTYKPVQEPDENSVFWTQVYNLPYHVVYGHHAHSFDEVDVFINPDGKKLIGVDTACCFGGYLSAYCLETGEIVQVKAKKVYQETVEF